MAPVIYFLNQYIYNKNNPNIQMVRMLYILKIKIEKTHLLYIIIQMAQQIAQYLPYLDCLSCFFALKSLFVGKRLQLEQFKDLDGVIYTVPQSISKLFLMCRSTQQPFAPFEQYVREFIHFPLQRYCKNISTFSTIIDKMQQCVIKFKELFNRESYERYNLCHKQYFELKTLLQDYIKRDVVMLLKGPHRVGEWTGIIPYYGQRTRFLRISWCYCTCNQCDYSIVWDVCCTLKREGIIFLKQIKNVSKKQSNDYIVDKLITIYTPILFKTDICNADYLFGPRFLDSNFQKDNRRCTLKKLKRDKSSIKESSHKAMQSNRFMEMHTKLKRPKVPTYYIKQPKRGF